MATRLKVVAINGSPHMGAGNASLMTRMMVPTLADRGIDLEEVFLAEKDIGFCVGCGACIEKGQCWRQDDHADILQQLFAADGVILASPVYFGQVTAQTKAFVDRSLAYGHKPRGSWKPGMAISVSAGMGEIKTAEYLANLLRVYGAYSVATFTAIAARPGAFLGKDLVEARAAELADDLARAIREKRRYPATENDLFFHLYMGNLIERERDFMRDDFSHWRELGFFDRFEAYIGQRFSVPSYSEEMRKEWSRNLIARERARAGAAAVPKTAPPTGTPLAVSSCRELLRAMPSSFQEEKAGDLAAVFQFEISGEEEFTAHLRIAGGRCTYAEGAHARPDVTIKAPAAVWLAVSRGELDGQSAFMAGQYRAEGDLGLLMKLQSLFRA